MKALKLFLIVLLIGGGFILSSALIPNLYAQDDFETFETMEEPQPEPNQPVQRPIFDPHLKTALVVLFWVILAGLAVRYSFSRPFRGLSLLLGILYFGFYRGGCPCMIMSFHKMVFSWFDSSIPWTHTLWFLLLIPLTYFFGRVWCGWICHLGALQEFLHLNDSKRFWQGVKWQKGLRFTRILVLILLTVQLIITRTNYWQKIDPFKSVFNLYAHGWLAWGLLGVLLISSVFIYRPFCRGLCPVGLILGWISKIPGASVIGNNGQCSGCRRCDNFCQIQAIAQSPEGNILDNSDCIACGKCVEKCGKKALSFFRKGEKHESLIFCKRKKDESDCSDHEI